MTDELSTALAAAHTQRGQSLAELSDQSPLLVVLLRHAGCTFCREALADLAARRTAIEKLGTRIVVVHFGDPATMDALLAKYGLAEVDRVADPQRRLYQAFELPRGRWRQLMGLQVLWRGLQAAILAGHWFGRPTADVRQMPGAFLVHRRRIVRAFRHRTAADRPDYEQLACPVE